MTQSKATRLLLPHRDASLLSPCGVMWAVARVALRVAVRRWPAPLRAEMAQEWAAELYEIDQDRRTGDLARAGKATAFAVSLACSRPPTSEAVPGIAVGSVGKRQWKPVATLALAPVVAFAVNVALFAAVVLVMELVLGPDLDLRRPLVMLMPMFSGVPVIVLGWYAGRSLGRRFADRPLAPSPGSRATWVALVLAAGTLAAQGPSLFEGLARGFMGWEIWWLFSAVGNGPVTVAVLMAVWTAGIALVGRMAVRRLEAGSRRGAAAVIVPGWLLVTYLAGTAYTAALLAPHDPTLAAVPLWFPASFVIIPSDPTFGYTADGFMVAGVISDDAGLVGYVLLTVGAIGLSYLLASASPAASAESSPGEAAEAAAART